MSLCCPRSHPSIFSFNSTCCCLYLIKIMADCFCASSTRISKQVNPSRPTLANVREQTTLVFVSTCMESNFLFSKTYEESMLPMFDQMHRLVRSRSHAQYNVTWAGSSDTLVRAGSDIERRKTISRRVTATITIIYI